MSAWVGFTAQATTATQGMSIDKAMTEGQHELHQEIYMVTASNETWVRRLILYILKIIRWNARQHDRERGAGFG